MIEWKDVNKELPKYKKGDLQGILVINNEDISGSMSAGIEKGYMCVDNIPARSGEGLAIGPSNDYKLIGINVGPYNYRFDKNINHRLSSLKNDTIRYIKYWAYINKPE